MVKDFTIELSQSSFVAGSTVCGSVVVKVNEPKNYKKIAVYLKGHGKVKWKETVHESHTAAGPGHHSTSTSRTITHKSEESYICEEFVVWENSDGALPTGHHTFPFQFTIPTNCPSSFRDKIGKIEYIIAGKIKSKSFFKKDHVIRHVINVLGFVDTSCQATQEPVIYAKEKHLGMLCFPRGTINYSVSLPHTLFCVGEDIRTQLKVENESGRRLKIEVSLVEKIDYITPRKETHSKNIIMVQKSTSLQPHRTSYWDSENFLVPAIRPAIVGSNIIRSGYFLHIVVKIPWSFNSSMTIPVVIGNARETNRDPQTTAHGDTFDRNRPVFATLHDYPPAIEPSSYWN